MKTKPIAIALALAVAGLVLGATAALAGPAEVAAINAACGKTTNWTPGACACVAAKSADLSPLEQQFVVAIITKDQPKIVELRLKMTAVEANAAALFFANSGPACQGK